MSTMISLGSYARDMVFPQKFFVDMNSYVLGMVNFLQTFVVDFIIKSNNFTFICYCENFIVQVCSYLESESRSLCTAVVSSFDLSTR